MKLSFFGGARALTGSCFLLEVDGQNILIDCGIQQTSDQYNGNALDFYASQIDHVLVTHAHIDNTGRLPLLIQEGYYGRIITTPSTKRLMNLVLREAADHHTTDSWWRNKKGQRSGVTPIEPLYSMMDVVSTMQQVETQEFNQVFQLCSGVNVRFVHSGHMIGSSSIEIWATEGDETKKIVFSGDLGCKEIPYASPPTYLEEADFLVLESTFGNKTHTNTATFKDIPRLAEAIENTLSRSGNVIIPANAVGRTQEVLHALSLIKKENLVRGVPDFKVYVDSFLAEEIVHIFEEETVEHLGSFSLKDVQGENNPLIFDDLVLVTSLEQSKALNYDKTPKVIIAGSGFGDRGRMKHHLKHNLWRKECAILHLGFLGEGSFGRRLQDGLSTLRIFGEDVVVRAKLLEFTGNPSHADQPQLLDWIGAFQEKPQLTFLVHGTEPVIEEFNQCLQRQGYQTHVPFIHECYNLLTKSVEIPGFNPNDQTLSRRSMSISLPYLQLQDALRDLNNLVHIGAWHSKEDLERMTTAVQQVISTWEHPNEESSSLK